MLGNDAVSCPTLGLLKDLGKAWSAIILLELEQGGRGFNALAAATQASAKELSAKLQLLEEQGLVAHAEEYALTQKGKELADVLRRFKAFSKKWNDGLPEDCEERSCARCAYQGIQGGARPA
jgi:DNA-binding HxlR family transcriptional regulator